MTAPCPCGAPIIEVAPDGARCRSGHFTPRGDDGRVVLQTAQPANGHAENALPESPRIAPEEKNSGKASNGRPAAFRLTTLAEMRDMPDERQEWTVGGLMVSAGTSLLPSKPKVGKSTFTRALARAVALGVPFLGRPVRQGRVLMLALEERPMKVRQHLDSMGGLDGAADAILVHCGAAPEDAITALRAAIAVHQPVLVIVDTLAKFARIRDLNDYSEVTRVMEPITELARQTGAHICLTHHLGKGERTDEGDAILGSTALFAAVDGCVLLKRRPDGTRTISSIQRDGDDMPETVLKLDPSTGLVAIGGTVAEEQQTATRQTILDELGGEPLTEADIRERTGIRALWVSAALRALADEGVIARIGAGKKGDPYRYRRADREEQEPPEEREEQAGEEDRAAYVNPEEHEQHSALCANCGQTPVDWDGQECGLCE